MRWRDIGLVTQTVASGGTFIATALSGGVAEARTLTQSPLVTGSSSGLAVALTIMAMATLVSVGTALYLYRWRRILLADPKMLVPEELGKFLNELAQSITDMSGAMSSGLTTIGQATSRNSEDVANMIETFMTLQKAVDERDEEIKRHKKGYDARVYRKFINRFIRVDQFIDTYLENKSESAEDLAQVKRLLQDALDECGVEAFTPEVGMDSRKADGIADNPKTEKTTDADEDFKILEVIEPGYRLNGGDNDEILMPAKVRIAVFEA